MTTFFLPTILVFCLALTNHANATANQAIQLPSIGRISAITTKEEKRIGSAVLKQYRRRVPISSDPIMTEYLEALIDHLASYSELEDPSISLIIAINPTLNAFAVPGGIIGIHTGLLTYAKTEQQLASVLAHELAHLSQRHYARGVAKQKKESITTTAAFIASIILAASGGGDAGAAALTATQAYAIDKQLRFSRSFEREADRLGMDILVKANLDPHATEEMFTQMERLSRFSTQPPEFLLTHPLTNNRIVDAINLARKHPKRVFAENINYQLVRARALLLTEPIPLQAINRFRRELSGFDTSINGNRYGLALALINDKQLDEAEELLTSLLETFPNNIILNMSSNDLLAQQGNIAGAIKNTKALLKKAPTYYPLNIQLGRLYHAIGDYAAASQLLLEQSTLRAEDPSIWYELAEVAGLNNNIPLLHKARAEYFILHAGFDDAEQQLKALIQKEKNTPTSDLYVYAKQRLGELGALRKSNKL